MDAGLWHRAGPLFDELVALDPGARAMRLHGLDETLRDLLARLLDAHDSADSILIDRTLGSFVDRLLDDAGSSTRIPADLVGRRFGNWRALEEIGRGGMGVVLRGERADGGYEMQAAIKLLPPGRADAADQARIAHELRLLARLDSPHIARLLDGGISEDGIPYIVMEFVEGEPITHHVESAGASLADTLMLFRQVAEAVADAHRRLVIHQDIKPSNVLVDHQGRVRLLDFGIATLIGDEHAVGDVFPASCAVRCSPPYAAPEQLHGAPAATAQDIFGLGALLYELLCGQCVRSTRDALAALAGEPLTLAIAPPSTRSPGRAWRARLPGDLDAICLRCLASDPEQRYPTVAALIDDIDRWSHHQPVAARVGGRMYRAGKWLRRHRLSAVIGAAAVLSLLGGLGAALWQAGVARDEAARAHEERRISDVALARAHAVQGFLLDLFRSAEPTRPRERLPSTEAILELGAQRALDADTVPSAERFGMLHTIAEIYLGQGLLDRSGPLVDEAYAMAFVDRFERPEDYALALRQKGWQAMRQRHLDDAEAYFLQAEAWLDDRPRYLRTARQSRADRGWLQLMRYDHAAALAVLEPLYAELEGDMEADAPLRYSVINALAHAYHQSDRLEDAALLRDRLAPLVVELHGAESLGYAIHLTNAAALGRDLGRFQPAQEALVAALDLLQRIFGDQPVEYRAAALHQLARLHLYRGEIEAALDVFAASSAEWAGTRGSDPARYPYGALHRAIVLGRAGDWEGAHAAATSAREFFGERPDTPVDILLHVDILIARAGCETAAGANAGEIAGELLNRLSERSASAAEISADLHEARAACLARAGAGSEALIEIDRSLAVFTPIGRAIEIVQRRLLRAELLIASGRASEAASELGIVESTLAAAGLEWRHLPASTRMLRSRLSSFDSG
ncbi:MAG TPA: serine/threonine-protein kinase [Xanthomonadaceae bacterium]|nr:serine/threonine-protein kinase [Xanthomonadaceae bacterium]